MACILETKVWCAGKYERMRFGSLHEVINEVHINCFEQNKKCLEQEKKVHNKNLSSWFKRGKKEGRYLEQDTIHEEVSK